MKKTKNSGASLPGETLFLSLDEVIEIHQVLIARFGGPQGMRDPGLLESALYRPQSGYYEDLPSMAAALFESLINNHPFVDDNKRVAFFATDVFLRMNGWCFAVEAQPAYRTLMQMFETHTCDLQHLKPWIENNIRPLAA